MSPELVVRMTIRSLERRWVRIAIVGKAVWKHVLAYRTLFAPTHMHSEDGRLGQQSLYQIPRRGPTSTRSMLTVPTMSNDAPLEKMK